MAEQANQKSGEALFLSNLTLIDEIIKYVCLAHGLRGDEVEDFGSEVKIKLMKDDYAVLAKFQGKCSLRTYLNTVINRFLIDQKIGEQGRWRPSQEAKQLGEVAIKMEELLYRNRYSFEEACEILQSKFGIGVTKSELDLLAARLPHRKLRDVRVTNEEELRHLANPVASIGWKNDPKGPGIKQQIQDLLNEHVASLTSEDRLILKMRFLDNFKVSEIAAALQINQKSLYWRIDRILKEMKEKLSATGIPETVILEVIEEYDKEMQIEFED
jgi:RNA polymerase sigma factor (sigma-70 family)